MPARDPDATITGRRSRHPIQDDIDQYIAIYGAALILEEMYRVIAVKAKAAEHSGQPRHADRLYAVLQPLLQAKTIARCFHV